jgi:hypothetical protein
MAGKSKGKEDKNGKNEGAAGKELLLLWAILGEGGGKAVSRATLEKKGMLPNEDKKVRDGLEARGLITKVDSPRDEQGRPAKGIWMTVTKAGLAWAEENLAAMPAKSQAATPILQAWLARLSVLLNMRNIPMAVFLDPRRGDDVSYGSGAGTADSRSGTLHELSQAEYHPGPSPLNGEYDSLRSRIRQAYLAVTGNRVNTRARLSDIRGKLNDIDSATLDAALKRMQREQQAILYALDNKAEITDADRSAAIYFGNEPCHILWIER